MDLTPGTVIAGRYRVDRKVGAGGMGEVWSGEHLAIGVRVAVKTLLKAAAMNHEVVARFKREAYVLGRIRSDHVARVVDFIADEDYGLVLVMDFVEGDSLARILMERQLSVEETVELGVDVALALTDLHKAQVVHRDLKPGNIILQPPSAGRRRAVVVDFGVSRIVAQGSDEETITGITKADMAVGTIEYMAPEQVLNSRNVTTGSDLYALGAIMFRAVAGRHVFGTCSSDSELAQKKLTIEAPRLPLARSDEIAEGLATAVAKALRRRPAERYQKADDLLADMLPLRERARTVPVHEQGPSGEHDMFDMDTTTQGDSMLAKGKRPKGEPPRAPATTGVAAATSVEADEARAALASLPAAPVESPARSSDGRRGVSPGMLVAAMGIALAGGVALGAVALRGSTNGSTDLATSAPSATPSVAPSATAAPTASAQVVASAAPSSSASVAIAADPASAEPIVIGDLDELPTVVHTPRAPKPQPSASASAGASPSAGAVSSSAATAAPTSSASAPPKPSSTATPSASPTSSPASAPSTQATSKPSSAPSSKPAPAVPVEP